MNSPTDKHVGRSYELSFTSDSDHNVVSDHEIQSLDQGLSVQDGHERVNLIPRKPLSSTTALDLPDMESKITDVAVQSRKPRRKLERIQIWWLEIISCILSVAALVAIIITLWRHDGNPLPDWRYHLTINTLISIYVVVLKTVLLFIASQGIGQLKWGWYDTERPLSHISTFDDATRGPQGSLRLLWMLKGRSLIASLGAFVTIAVLFVEPFTQQVISSQQCFVPANTNATMTRTNFFLNAGDWDDDLDGNLSADLQNAIVKGVFKLDQQVAFDCPSENCDFREYHSVGYCSSCNDTTDEVVVFTKNNTGQGPYANLTFTGYEEPMETAVLYLTNQSDVNSVYLLMNYDSGSNIASVLATTTYQNYSCLRNEALPWGCGKPLSGDCVNDGFSCGYYGAANCTIRPCVKTYNATVENGILNEKMVSSADLWTWETMSEVNYPYDSNIYLATINKACLTEQTRNQVAQLGSTSEADGWFSTPNLTANYFELGGKYLPEDYWLPNHNITSPNISVPAECVYLIDTETDDGIQIFLSNYLSGNVNQYPDSNPPHAFNGTTQLITIYNDGKLSFRDLNDTFTDISNSLTQYIRQNGVQDFSAPSLGTVRATRQCIKVHWEWLVYVVVLVALTLLFFTATVISTYRGERKSHDWKSEALVLMLHSLDDETRSYLTADQLVKTREMHRAAERMKVQLRKKDGGWAFVASTPLSSSAKHTTKLV